MQVAFSLNFSPVDPGRYILYGYVDGVSSGNPQQPIRIDTAEGFEWNLNLDVGKKTSLFGVLAFQVTKTSDGRIGYVNSGWAVAPIADLLQGQNLNVLIQHNTNELGNLLKGTIGVQASYFASNQIAYPLQMPQDLSDSLMSSMMSVIDQVYAPVTNLQGRFALSKNLKAPFWYTDVGPLPFPVFNSRYNVVPPSNGYLLNLVKIGAERNNLNLAQFGVELKKVLQGEGDVKTVGRVYSSVLTGYSNALPYLTDYALKGKVRLMAEWFDRAYLRQSCDCEDFARIVCAMHRWIVDAGGISDNPILKALAVFAEAYVCMMLLGTVTQPSLGNSVNEHESEQNYNGHMWAMLVPKEQYAAWQGVALQPTAWTANYSHGFVLEGTGYMDPVVVETEEERMARDSINRAIRAFPGLDSLPHNIATTSMYHLSPFYRQAMMCYAPPLNDYQSDWYNEFAWVKGSLHGVTFDEIVQQPNSIALKPMNPYPDEIKRLSYACLANMCPERAPRMGPAPEVQEEILLGAYAGSQQTDSKGNLVHFYLPAEPQIGLDVERAVGYLENVVKNRNHIVSSASYRVEVFDENVSQVRLSLKVNT